MTEKKKQGGEMVKARAAGAMTHRQERAWRGYLSDPGASQWKVLRRAGYSEATSHNPGQNGLARDQLERRVARRADISPGAVGKLGLGVLVELADDQGQSPTVRGAAAKELVAYGALAGDDDNHVSRDDHRDLYLHRLRKLALALSWAVRHPLRAEVLVERLEARLEALSAPGRASTGRSRSRWDSF